MSYTIITIDDNDREFAIETDTDYEFACALSFLGIRVFSREEMHRIRQMSNNNRLNEVMAETEQTLGMVKDFARQGNND